MLITVQRKTLTPLSTQGEMLLNGAHEAYTLEPQMDQSRGKPYAVPAGMYDYRVGWSARFNRDVIQIENIPGFTDVEVHPGNFPRDTHGCCLVGKTEGANFVGHSDEEFNELMLKVSPTGQIEYVNPPEPSDGGL